MAALAEADKAVEANESIFEGQNAPSMQGVVASGADTFSDAKPSETELTKIEEMRKELTVELGESNISTTSPTLALRPRTLYWRGPCPLPCPFQARASSILTLTHSPFFSLLRVYKRRSRPSPKMSPYGSSFVFFEAMLEMFTGQCLPFEQW